MVGVVRVLNEKLVEHAGEVIRPGRPTHVVAMEDRSITEDDARHLLREHPGCRVVLVCGDCPPP
jgi:hypothetical protein